MSETTVIKSADDSAAPSLVAESAQPEPEQGNDNAADTTREMDVIDEGQGWLLGAWSFFSSV